MVIQEGQFFKKVLGLRLTYLSDHAGVREYILQALDNDDFPLNLRDINVNEVHMDFVGDEKDAFVTELNALMPGSGDNYAREVHDDTFDDRQHRWDTWLGWIGENPALGEALKDAIRHVLSYGKKVEVGGKYEGGHRKIEYSDSDHPRLTFHARAGDIGGESKEED